jgi:SAM-dependent MidA family methyltransferase
VSPPASIAAIVAGEGGRVTFARFMELALTHPTLGYYSRAGRLLGRRGDFSTAPALSPFFNRTLARLVTELLEASLSAEASARSEAAAFEGPPSGVIELGGGEGQLAAAILAKWEVQRPELRRKIAYRMVEIGEGLRQRQAEAVAGFVSRGWDVGWGSTLGEAGVGTRPVVIVGNEFIDTLPVHLVRVADGHVGELHVRAVPTGGLAEEWGPLSDEAAGEIEVLFGDARPERLTGLTSDGVIEVFPGLTELFREVAEVMPSGSLVSVDYGGWFLGVPKTGERWGLEDRAPRRRTVRGYFKHQLVLDVLARPGRHDLTADVDFAALDLHGRRQGFETVLFTTLAAFLGAGGGEAELAALQAAGREDDALEADRQATVLRSLLEEHDLGGAYKVMVQVRE